MWGCYAYSTMAFYFIYSRYTLALYGTSCMKFIVNGALTLATLDGANIEILDEVGAENIFIFGLKAEEVTALRPNYNPRESYEKNPLLKKAIDIIHARLFSPEEPSLFHPLIDSLLGSDYYMVLADFEEYSRCQKRIDALYRDQDAWTKKTIINVARMGIFSSDRTIAEYNREIWHAATLKITTHDE
jgi:glycogen phosphorylase